MKVLNDYGTHHYFENYSLDRNIYCPNCASFGKVWVEAEGDYYCGPTHLCTNCCFEFTMPTSGIGDERVKKIVEQLKSGIMNKPTNEKGR